MTSIGATVAFARPTRHYRDFLTPALHTRFVHAAVLLLGLCYVEAIWLGEWHCEDFKAITEKFAANMFYEVFWQWFPIGPAGVRTLLLFISCLAILVLRVAQIHGRHIVFMLRKVDIPEAHVRIAGPRTTTYPLETLYQQVTSIKAYQTVAWYAFSALMYCEVYIWSAPKNVNLHFVEPIR